MFVWHWRVTVPPVTMWAVYVRDTEPLIQHYLATGNVVGGLEWLWTVTLATMT